MIKTTNLLYEIRINQDILVGCTDLGQDLSLPFDMIGYIAICNKNYTFRISISYPIALNKHLVYNEIKFWLYHKLIYHWCEQKKEYLGLPKDIFASEREYRVFIMKISNLFIDFCEEYLIQQAEEISDLMWL